MSPPPERSETNASVFPSGEYDGCDSFAVWETSRRASPPASGAVQRSPPDAKAISERSGAIAGSVKYGRGSEGGAGVWGACAGCADTSAPQAATVRTARRRNWIRMARHYSTDG